MSLIINLLSNNKHINHNIIIHGDSGVGKTTLAETTPDPKKTLIIDFEKGSKYLDSSKGISVLDMYTRDGWFKKAELEELFKTVKEKYDYIFVDTIGSAFETIEKDTNLLIGTKNRQADGSLSMGGYGNAKRCLDTLVEGLISTGKNIIVLAHTKDKDDENGEPTKRISCPTAYSDEIKRKFDWIGYYFTTKTKRGIFFGNNQNIDSKSRLPNFVSYEEPNIEPDLKVIYKRIDELRNNNNNK